MNQEDERIPWPEPIRWHGRLFAGVLAKSDSYLVRTHWEEAILESDGATVSIGNFYGNPHCALIDRNEDWCVVGGCGLIVYWPQDVPFQIYRFGQDPDDIWWVERFEQVEDHRVKFEIDEPNSHAGAHELDILTMKVKRLAD